MIPEQIRNSTCHLTILGAVLLSVPVQLEVPSGAVTWDSGDQPSASSQAEGRGDLPFGWVLRGKGSRLGARLVR
ncbi:hypothetical protein C8Q79DRAFT_232467 [Trametes meyenii]|nr:hypothetical protein C8Q79DRAFT_232467 [Trametes meyenii]